MGFFTKDEILERIALSKPAGQKADLHEALIIAASALYEKTTKDGQPYMYHPLDVATRRYGGYSHDKQIVAILHDVVEDSDWTLADLRRAGFEDKIVDAVDALTIRPGEEYFDFIVRCSLNALATDIKLADLKDNSDLGRSIKLLSDRDMQRTNKYIVAKEYLIAVKRKEIAPGSSMVDFILSRPGLYDRDLMMKNSLEYRGRQAEFAHLRAQPQPQ